MDAAPGKFDADAHHALARRAAAQSIVLLKNENSLLPLAKGEKVAVIGDFAQTPRYQGAGSSAVNSIKVDSFLDCLAESGLSIVDLPTPGSPLSSTTPPNTMPPPKTRSSSEMPVRMRLFSSVVLISERPRMKCNRRLLKCNLWRSDRHFTIFADSIYGYSNDCRSMFDRG